MKSLACTCMFLVCLVALRTGMSAKQFTLVVSVDIPRGAPQSSHGGQTTRHFMLPTKFQSFAAGDRGKLLHRISLEILGCVDEPRRVCGPCHYN